MGLRPASENNATKTLMLLVIGRGKAGVGNSIKVATQEGFAAVQPQMDIAKVIP
jgi:hypothetical protein